MRLEMFVKGLAIDPITNMPIIILRTQNGSQTLPIWVGVFEANAIALELEKVKTPRPMTHDLANSMIEHLKAKITKIVINDLKDSTYFAKVEIESEQGMVSIDARPSDAIALALRAQASILVEEDVIEKSRSADLEESEQSEKEQLKKWLETLKPEDFGGYKM